MIGNKSKKKTLMTSIFLVVFDFSMYVASSGGKEKVTEVQQNSFPFLTGGIIIKHFHLECKKYGYVEVCKHEHFLMLISFSPVSFL